MDMRQYIGSNYIRDDDVRDRPRRGRIANVRPGSDDKAIIELHNGDCISLNQTNSCLLVKAFGTDSRDWIGCEVEMYLCESVLVCSLTKTARATAPQRSFKDMDDEIPF